MDQWYYSREGQQLGPVAWEELYRLASSGQIAATDLVWREGMPNWAEARTIPNLLAAPATPAPSDQPQVQPVYAQPLTPMNYYGPSAPSGPRPKNYLTQSILVTLCCCLPFGIVAIVYSAQVNSKWDRGDYEGAAASSKSANTWGIVALVCGLLAGVIRLVAVLASHGRF
jgi:hypothetical protein